jgi:hypothetical protein
VQVTIVLALAHLPSGRFDANNAWLTCIAIAHNLTCVTTYPNTGHGNSSGCNCSPQVHSRQA